MRLQRAIHRSYLERHVHIVPYAALVISGSYEEAGDNGRFLVNAGNVLFHDAFEGHLNRFGSNGATILNLPVHPECSVKRGLRRVDDPDRVIRLAEKNWQDAVEFLLSVATVVEPQPNDWPEELAITLSQSPSLKLSKWAEEKALRPWAVSRGFYQVFGISPESYRGRVRARLALRLIQQTEMPMTAVATELGFSDQAHMSRSIKRLTGFPPQAWRRCANGFKTGAGAHLYK
jgi:AraC-like DNA-binding protein